MPSRASSLQYPTRSSTGMTGQVAWSLKEYEFLYGDEVPPTVNPSLWRQAALNMNNGLFKIHVTGIYQVRGFDMASMMIIEGNKRDHPHRPDDFGRNSQGCA